METARLRSPDPPTQNAPNACYAGPSRPQEKPEKKYEMKYFGDKHGNSSDPDFVISPVLLQVPVDSVVVLAYVLGVPAI